MNENASHRADSAVVCAFVSFEPNSQVIVCLVEISCETPSLIKSYVKTSSFEKNYISHAFENVLPRMFFGNHCSFAFE